MKFCLQLVVLSILLFSCEKDSSEEGGGDNPNIVGNNCRINKIVYRDSSDSTPIGSIAANINGIDQVISITEFDSLSNFLLSYTDVYNFYDTVYVNDDEFFVEDPNGRLIKKFHGLVDPGNPSSPFYDVVYTYNTAGNLVKKVKALSQAPAVPIEQVDYSYSNGNLVSMNFRNLVSGKKISDATLTYNLGIRPTNYFYLFPDAERDAAYNQFFNFGKRSLNAVSTMKVKHYDNAGVVTDSLVSSFTQYQQSADLYILKVLMQGDEQPSIPAKPGRMQLSYYCR